MGGQKTHQNGKGNPALAEAVLHIDRELAGISSSYRFLLMVAPINRAEIQDGFFQSAFRKVPVYRYRPLPIDVNLLKRQLFNLQIENIEDPSLHHLYAEKREEIDRELTMLSERGTRNFFYSSIRLYRGVDPEVLTEAEEILNKITPDEDRENPDARTISASDFAEKAKREFAGYREQCPEFQCAVHIRERLDVIMVSQGELFIPAHQFFSPRETIALTQHEIGTHVVTYYNGSRQPLKILADGLADYDPLQEGLAVMAEYFAGTLSGQRLRTLAGRVIAGNYLMQGSNFPDTFAALRKPWGFSVEEAFNITIRMFQGGGFLKDVVYLEGLVKLRKHLMNGGDFIALTSGKFALKHIPLIADLTERAILLPPRLRPGYTFTTDYQTRLEELTQGLPISQLHLP